MIARRRAARPTGPYDEDALAVGAAVRERAGHGAHRAVVRRPAVEGQRAADAAHGLRRPVAAHRGRRRRAPRLQHAPRRRDDQAQVEPTDRSASALEVVRELLRPRHVARHPQLGEPGEPGRTTSRCQYCGISSQSCSKKTGRIGRGPTSDMSPRTTFHSCGSSSRCTVRSQRPTRVSSSLVRSSSAARLVGAEPHLGVAAERAQLVHREDLAGAPDPQPAVEDRAAGGAAGSAP